MFTTLHKKLTDLFKEKTYTDILLVHPQNLVDKVINHGTIIYDKSTRNQLITLAKWMYDCDYDMAELVVDTSIQIHVEPRRKVLKDLDSKTREQILEAHTKDALKEDSSEAEAR